LSRKGFSAVADLLHTAEVTLGRWAWRLRLGPGSYLTTPSPLRDLPNVIGPGLGHLHLTLVLVDLSAAASVIEAIVRASGSINLRLSTFIDKASVDDLAGFIHAGVLD
jgi:hypothetical protein